MKSAILGTLVGMGLVMAAAAMAEQRGEAVTPRIVSAMPAAAAVAGHELIVMPTTLNEKTQMLTVVDERQRVLSVYHIDMATGKIALKSVRNIHWDLQINDLNNEDPLPQQIKSLLEQK